MAGDARASTHIQHESGSTGTIRNQIPKVSDTASSTSSLVTKHSNAGKGDHGRTPAAPAPAPHLGLQLFAAARAGNVARDADRRSNVIQSVNIDAKHSRSSYSFVLLLYIGSGRF